MMGRTKRKGQKCGNGNRGWLLESEKGKDGEAPSSEPGEGEAQDGQRHPGGQREGKRMKQVDFLLRMQTVVRRKKVFGG